MTNFDTNTIADRNKSNYLKAKEAFNRNDLDACVSFYAPDHQIRSKPSPKGRQAIRAFFEHSHQSWPDIQIVVEHVVAEDNWVMGRSVVTATHTTEVLGVKPTHKRIETTFWDLHLFDGEGLILETWNLMDSVAIMSQLGLLPEAKWRPVYVMNKQEKLMHTVAITEAVNRYFAALDQKQFDVTTLSQIFAEDAKIVRPNGAVTTGTKAIGDSHRHSLSRFRATQHLTSGFLITLTNDTSAEFRANLVAMHLWAEGHGDSDANPNDNYFLAGGVLTGRLLLQANEWRITEIANHVSWKRGTGFQQILETEFNQKLRDGGAN